MSTWSVRVLLDSVDVSARLLGELRIDAERAKSRVCSLSLVPSAAMRAANLWLPRDLEGRPLTIDIRVDSGAWVRRFTGRVLRAPRDPLTGVLALMGQDTRKAQANAADLPTILGWCAAGGGLYHEAIFGPRQTGMRQLDDVASTTWGTVECGPDDAIRWNSWATAATPGRTYARYLKGTLTEGTLDLDALVNRWTITFQWRYTRIWSRGHAVSWDWGNEWCDRRYPAPDGQRYWQNPWGLPDLSDVQALDGAAGWRIRAGRQTTIYSGEPAPFAYEMLPGSGWYDCDGLGGSLVDGSIFRWEISEAGRLESLTSFRVEMERHGAQDVERTYTLTVECPASIARYGARTGTETASGQTPYDATAWLDSAGSGTPPGYRSNGIGDACLDLVSEAEVEAAGACYLRAKAFDIRRTHRAAVSFEQPLDPAVELTSTVRLEQAGHVAVQAPVSRLVDILTFPCQANGYQGRAITALTLAVSRSAAGAQTDDDLLLPPAPDTDPTHTPHAGTTTLQTHVGRWPGCPDWDDDAMVGWRTNRSVRFPARTGTPPDPDPEEYVEGWNFSLPDIEAEMTDAVSGTTSATYSISVPHDEWTGGD